MITSNTQAHAKSIAEGLGRQRRLTIKHPNYPLNTVADSYVKPQFTDDASHDVITQEFFKNNTGTQSVLDSDEFDELTRNIAQGLKGMLLTIRTQVVPACKMIVEGMQATEENRSDESLEIKHWQLHAVHSAPAVEGLATDKHRHAEIKPPYKTLPFKHEIEGPELREMVAHSPSVGPEIKEWAWQFGDDDLWIIYHWLFGKTTTLDWSDLWMLDTQHAHLNIDQTLLGYALVDYLIHNPREVSNGGVSLEEWEQTLERLRYLLQVGYYRQVRAVAKARHEKRLVWSYDGQRESKMGIDTSNTPTILVDEVHVDAFFNGGGSIKTLMGARATDRACRTISNLLANKDQLDRAGEAEYVRQRKKAQASHFMRWRQFLHTMLMEVGVQAVEDERTFQLPHLKPDTFDQRWVAVSQQLHEDDTKDLWRTVTKVVCQMYYPDTPYHHYLHTMDRIAKTYTDAAPREIANLATVELLSQWLVDQVQVQAGKSREE